MKNKLRILFLFTLSLFQIGSLFAQNGFLFDDAQTFANDTAQAKLKERRKILAYYIGKADITNAEAKTIISNNQFLSKAVGQANYFDAKDTSSKYNGQAQGGLSSIGSLNVTNIADGIAKFIVSRGKQELSTAFFNGFKRDLLKYPELVVMFPRTSAIIKNIDSYNLLTVLQQLQDAFKKDLLNLPTDILSFRNKDVSMCSGDKNCIGQIDTIGNILNSPRSVDIVIALITAQDIINGKNIIDIANDIAMDTSVSNASGEYNGYIKLAAILLESFRTSQESKGLFVPVGNIKSMFLDPRNTNAFLGLILLKYSNLAGYKNLNINKNNLNDLLAKVQMAETNLLNGIQVIDNINAYILNYKAALKQGTASSGELYATIIVGSVGLLAGLGYTIHEIVKGELPSEVNAIKKDITLASDFANDVQKKNYSGIYNDINSLFVTFNIFKSSDKKEKIMKYFAFASNLASANSSDEVQQVLESVALPPGSYSVKQKSAFNISLNSYIGYGWDLGMSDGKLVTRGIDAPVGFSFSIGLGKKHGGALTLFTSLIDVGGLASFRLVNSMTDTLKQVVTLESIFSPSAQLIFEIPRTPIALSAGIRGTPKLSFNNGNKFIVIPTMDVINLSLLIDIPFFTMYNRPYQN